MRYLRHVLTTAYGKGIILQRLLILLLLPVSVSFVTCLNVSKTEAASFQGLGDLDGGPFLARPMAYRQTGPWWWAGVLQPRATRRSYVTSPMVCEAYGRCW